MPRPAFLNDYIGEWVAVKDGAVIAHTSSSTALAAAMLAMEDAVVDDAVIEFVPPPSDSWRVGVG